MSPTPLALMRRYAGMAMVVLVGALATTAGVVQDRQRTAALLQQQLELRARDEAARIQRNLDRVAEVVESLGGLFSGSIRVGRAQFREFVRGPLRFHPEIQALEWLPRVAAADRADFEASVRRDLPEFRITERSPSGKLAPATAREEFFPILFVEPLAGNEAALGLDGAFRRANRETMARARDTATPATTGRITLVQGNGRTYALAVYRPIYRQNVAIDTVEQRRAHLTGFGVALILPERMVSDALRDAAPSGLDVYLLDPAGYGELTPHDLEPRDEESLLYFQPSATRDDKDIAPQPGAAAAGLHQTIPVHLPGRELELLFSPAPGFYAELDSRRHWWVLATGLLLTLVLAVDLERRTRRTEKLSRMASELAQTNGELVERSKRLAEAQQLAHLGSWELDLVSGKLTWSEEIFRIFEIDAACFGATYEAFLETVHPEDRDLVDRAYRESVRGRTPYEIVHRLRMADGRVKHVQERGETFYAASGRPLRSIGTIQDITDRFAAEQRIRLMDYAIASSMNAIAIADLEGRLTYVNEAFRSAWGYASRDEVVGRSVLDFWQSPGDATKVVEHLRNSPSWMGELVAKRANGTSFDAQCSASLVTDDKGAPLCMMASFLDVSERKHAEDRLRQAATVFANTREGVVITDRHANVLDVNAAFTEILGYARDEVIGRNPRLWRSDRHDDVFYQTMWTAIDRAGHWQGEIWNRRKGGEVVPVWLSIDAVRDDAGAVTNYVAVFSDISGIKRSQAQLAYLAQHDPLTDLPNRLLFADRLRHALDRAEREQSQLALLFLDLDHFKHINDSMGHPTGDHLLKEVARRLCATLRKQDTVSRMGGDEFTVLLEELRSEQDAALLAEKVLNELAQPFRILGREFYITCSVGISVYPRDGATPEALVANADAAMYRSKAGGRNAFNFYTPGLTEAALERVQLETDLRRALADDALFVHYQPQVDMATGRVIGAEALVRWRHEDKGMIPPDRFIPVAEDSGLILPLGEKVLRAACRQARQWLDAGVGLDVIAVNVAGPQIQRNDFVATVRRVLEETGLPPHRLELEVTEGFIMREAEASIEALEQLREMGVKLSIDDFGTGYSSLAYLKRLPIHKLKIDRSFVRDLPGDEEDAAIARAVIVLARSLGIEVIAEGVETEAQREFLLRSGCDQAQGYLFGKPAAAGSFFIREAA